VGEDGFALLARLDEPGRPRLARLPRVEALRQVWARHFVREPAGPPAGGGGVRLRGKGDPPPAAPAVVSPYDTEARYRGRHATVWTGYVVHLSETCDDDTVHLITHAMTTDAAVNEVRCTAAIQRALAGKGLAPSEHLVDTAYVDAGCWCAAARSWASPWSAVAARRELAGEGRGRLRPRAVRGRLGARAGALPAGQAVLGLEPAGRAVRPLVRPRPVPQGRLRPLPGAGLVHAGQARGPVPEAAAAGRARGAQGGARAARRQGGRRLYARRAGIEGTISQGVRAFGLRRSRYRGLAKTHLQHVATAAAIDLGRLAAWFRAVPRAATRTSRFAALAA
jgi:hypothetical protein